MPLSPCLFERQLLPKVWGGRALEQVLGIPLPSGEAIGEAWELFDRPEGSSRIRGSDLHLADLMRAHPVELLGHGVAAGYGGRFPLMLKFLDARDALSVQVHPDDIDAEVERDGGKSEACVVLHAGPAARMVRGLRPAVDAAAFRANATTAGIEDLLWSFQPKVGDCIHIPAGTVHAIGPDLVVFEVQQNSDLTYRLYDWGRPRPVQPDKALAAARIEVAAAASTLSPTVVPQQLVDGGQLVVVDEHFRVRRYQPAAAWEFRTGGRYATITVVGGCGDLLWRQADGERQLRLQRADTVLIPASCAVLRLVPEQTLDLLICDPGAI